MKMGLEQASQNFTLLVRAVRAGQTVVLTDRGKPLAVVEPVSSKPSAVRDEVEAALDRLEARGLLAQRGSGRLTLQAGWKPIRLRGRTTTETIQEDRDEH
jgi:prevent-host-death family protein